MIFRVRILTDNVEKMYSVHGLILGGEVSELRAGRAKTMSGTSVSRS
jgi:hypothetical protein